jgi:hypothetical protein
MRLLLLLFLLFNSLLFPLAPVQAWQPSRLPGVRSAAGFQILELKVSYEFGLQASFEAQLTPAEEVREIYLMIQPQGATTRVESIPTSEDGHIMFIYDLAANPLRPFSPVNYWLRVTLKSGEQVESIHSTFLYEDNRFVWQYLENDDFMVKWYSGDLDFGQAVMDAATAGLEKVRELVDAPAPQPLRIYVYPSSTDLQAALSLINATWLAGHASPEFATVLISLAPGPSQQLEMERQLPHEITHILLYQAYSENYSRLPQWLNEGLASLSELYPNSDYKRALQKAGQNGSLLPMQSLCNSFPREASGAYLAYAQSESFVRFLSQKFGFNRLQELAGQYADGVDCTQGIQTVLGTSLDQLELRWKQEALKIDAELLAWQNLMPYLAILLLVLIPAIGGSLWLLRKK